MLAGTPGSAHRASEPDAGPKRVIFSSCLTVKPSATWCACRISDQHSETESVAGEVAALFMLSHCDGFANRSSLACKMKCLHMYKMKFIRSGARVSLYIESGEFLDSGWSCGNCNVKHAHLQPHRPFLVHVLDGEDLLSQTSSTKETILLFARIQD